MREIQKKISRGMYAHLTRAVRGAVRASHAHPAYIPRISYDIPRRSLQARADLHVPQMRVQTPPKRIPVTKPNPTDHPGESIVPMGHHVRTHWTGYGAHTLLNGILSQKISCARAKSHADVRYLTKSRVHPACIPCASHAHPAYIPRTSPRTCPRTCPRTSRVNPQF